MKMFEYKNIGIKIYKHVCKNGLEVYLAPNKNIKSFYVTLNVKYGSDITKFKIGDKLFKVPNGSAHFLEHKMFEQEDGITPFDFYSNLGLDCNASTNNIRTDYVFSGSNHFEEGLNFLLDYVATPYFTNENVEKEKGIIKQEILMYEDEPSQKLYDISFFNAYFKNQIRYQIGGKVTDIIEITKEDLYNIYEAFYQPQNMFLVITGNVDLKNTIKLIENNQSKKKFSNKKVEIIREDEPLKIRKNYEEVEGNVFISKFAINIKFNNVKLKEKVPDYLKYISFFLDSVLGSTSKLKEELIKKNLITYGFATDIVSANDYTSILITGETDNYKEVINYIMKALKEYSFKLKDFKTNSKLLKSYYVYMSDNIYSINSFIASQLINRGKINENIYLDVDKMNRKEYNYVMSQIDLNNYGVVIIKPKLKK